MKLPLSSRRGTCPIERPTKRAASWTASPSSVTRPTPTRFVARTAMGGARRCTTSTRRMALVNTSRLGCVMLWMCLCAWNFMPDQSRFVSLGHLDSQDLKAPLSRWNDPEVSEKLRPHVIFQTFVCVTFDACFRLLLSSNSAAQNEMYPIRIIPGQIHWIIATLGLNSGEKRVFEFQWY